MAKPNPPDSVEPPAYPTDATGESAAGKESVPPPPPEPEPPIPGGIRQRLAPPPAPPAENGGDSGIKGFFRRLFSG